MEERLRKPIDERNLLPDELLEDGKYRFDADNNSRFASKPKPFKYCDILHLNFFAGVKWQIAVSHLGQRSMRSKWSTSWTEWKDF